MAEVTDREANLEAIYAAECEDEAELVRDPALYVVSYPDGDGYITDEEESPVCRFCRNGNDRCTCP